MHYLVVVGIESGELRAVAIDTPEQGDAAARALIADWLNEGVRVEGYAMKVLARVEGGTVYHEGFSLVNSENDLEVQAGSERGRLDLFGEG
jgi:hypothetical protein